LIHARTDTPRWSETYDRRLHDILALQTELARAIVDGIKLKLTKRDSARLSAVARVDTAGYDAYLRGRYHWNRRTGDDLRKAIAAFREALARDPAYAPAYVGIADCLLTLVSYGLVAPRQAMPEMKSLVVKALALDSDLPEAHLACAMVNFYYDWDWVATERSLTRALKLNSRSAIAHLWHGLYLVTQGRTAESARAIARARELEPLSPAIGALSAWALHLGRKHEAAAELCLAMLELDPNFFLAHMSLAVALEEQSRYPEALSAMSTALAASRADQVGRTVIARLHARNGDMATARAMLEELVAAAATRYLSAYHVAAIHLALGEPDSAFEWLDRAYEDRALHMVTLNVDPAFDNLRGDARFAKLQQRLGWR
jgi:tetratricopeptide (TPR) repeat protein